MGPSSLILIIGAVGPTLEETLAKAEDVLLDNVIEMDKRGWPVPGPAIPGGMRHNLVGKLCGQGQRTPVNYELTLANS